MADIRIHREHKLGLAKARKVAWAWAEQVEKKFDMACTVIEGETNDTVEFRRTGVNGRLIVAADHFDLDALCGQDLGGLHRDPGRGAVGDSPQHRFARILSPGPVGSIGGGEDDSAACENCRIAKLELQNWGHPLKGTGQGQNLPHSGKNSFL